MFPSQRTNNRLKGWSCQLPVLIMTRRTHVLKCHTAHPEGCTITMCCEIVFKLPRPRFGIFFSMSLAMGQTPWELVTLYYRT